MIRKRISTLFYLTPILLFHSVSVTAQGLYVTGSTYLVLNGSPAVVLDNCNLTNNGTLQQGSSTVKFSGNAATATINGSNITFNNLSIDKSAGDVVLNTGIDVTGNLDMLSRHIELNNNNIDLGSTGTIVGESNASYITGTTGGLVLRQDNLNAPTAANPGNIGIDITSAVNMGATQIARGHVVQMGTSSGIGIERYFDITPANNAGLNATLTFHYLDDELGTINESELAMSAREVPPIWYWTLLGVDAANTSTNILTKTAIDTLGRFTLTSSLNNTLPLGLLAFSGKLVNKQTHLNWEVANGLTFAKYDIERSADGKRFTTLGSVNSNGRMTPTYNYSYIDFDPYKGLSYYRLKLYDNSNRSSYSQVIRIELNDAGEFNVYPNPVTDKVYVTFYSDKERTAEMTIIDNYGKMVATKQVQCNIGANNIAWDISALASATYYLKLDGVHTTAVKLTKL